MLEIAAPDWQTICLASAREHSPEYGPVEVSQQDPTLGPVHQFLLLDAIPILSLKHAPRAIPTLTHSAHS